MADSLQEWLVSKFKGLSIDAEVYGEYVNGIMCDEETPLDERSQTVVDILSATTEEDLSEFQIELVQKYNEANEAESLKKQKELELKKEAERKVKEDEKLLVEKELEKQRMLAEKRKNLTPEERERRERMISDYGYSSISEFDEDGNLIDAADSNSSSDIMSSVSQNSNRARVQQAQQAIRESSKKQHASKVKREKELLEKDKIRKETRKNKTVKKEKQRGCG